MLNRLHGLKILLGILILALTFAEHLPADWTVRLLIPAAQKRLVDGVVGEYATKRCTREGGAAALRKLLSVSIPKPVEQSTRLLSTSTVSW